MPVNGNVTLRKLDWLAAIANGKLHRPIRALSKKLTPRAKWQQHKQMLANVGVIEGGSHGKRNHLHLVLTKPDHVSEEQFRRAIYKLTYSNAWMMGHQSIQTTAIYVTITDDQMTKAVNAI